MFKFFLSGGEVMWFLLLISVIIVFLSFKKGIDLFSGKELSKPKLESGINAIAFWGGLNVILGLFFHFWGVARAMQAISQANDISPAIVAMGYKMALVSIITSLFIFIVSLLIWFVFRWRYKNLVNNIN
jgi:biopolymer transport protein ExbB/TolQ